MLTIHIPQTSSRVTWPSSTRRTVHIAAALPLLALKSGSKDSIPIELKFTRSRFDLLMKAAAYFQEAHPPEELDVIRAHLPKHMRGVIGCRPQELLGGWAHSITETLHHYGLHCAGEQSRPIMDARWLILPDPKESQYRKARQTLTGGFCGVSFRLVLQRSGLRALGALCGTPEGRRDLAFAVRWHLLPSILADWGLNGLPRRRHLVQAQFLQHTATTAIMMARALMVQIAKGDETRQAALREIMNQDKYATVLENIGKEQGTEAVHALQRQIALWLAERTLRPAWSLHRINSPLERDPNKAYKQLCPPHRRIALRDLLKALPPQQRDVLVQAWFRRLLGHVGQAARDLDLL